MAVHKVSGFLLLVFIYNLFSESFSISSLDFIRNSFREIKIADGSRKNFNKSVAAVGYESNGSSGKLFIDQTSKLSVEMPLIFFSDNVLNENSDIPPQLAVLLSNIDRELTANPLVMSNNSKNTMLGKRTVITDSVAPFIRTKWSQNWPYNANCPMDNTLTDLIYNKHVPAGCLAVAMAQVMHYYRYPKTGSDSISYTDSYGVHSANFRTIINDWDNMPDSLSVSSSTQECNTVSKFIYDCGVSIKTVYGANGSRALFDTLVNSFVKYYNYSPSIFGRDPLPFETSDDWKNALKKEIDYKRPILFSAQGTIAHGFIIDGYKYIDGTLFFHINWGWGGKYDGYFNIDYLKVGSYTFDGRHQACIYIAPPVLSAPLNVRLVLDPYPPVAAWDPVDGAKGYFMELRTAKSQSLGPIEGHNSTTTDLRIVYNLGLNDTLFFKVCAVDSAGLYSNWSYLTVINNGKLTTKTINDKQNISSKRDINITKNKGVYVLTIEEQIMAKCKSSAELFSINGKKVTDWEKTGNNSYQIRSDKLTPGYYFSVVMVNGKKLISSMICLSR